MCENVVDNLRSKFRMGEESLFDPFDVRGNEGLIGLVKDPLTRQHMVNMAQQGWSAIEEASAEEETPSQQAARIIAKKNFGAVIGRETTTFFDPSLKEEMFKDSNVLQVLVPPTTYAGKCIQRMVDATKSSILDCPMPLPNIIPVKHINSHELEFLACSQSLVCWSCC